jgi:prephenate dehydrogenase
MKRIIGVIGATGDLGSQLVKKLEGGDFVVVQYSRSRPNGLSINAVMERCDIVHMCCPLSALEAVVPGRAVIVLHDSVMSSSLKASKQFTDGKAAVVHMLMNKTGTVVVATDAPHHDLITEHLRSIGLEPKGMTVREHDYLIARSQAPLALLCETLLPYLYKQAELGLLTPSGELLASTLHSRELTWTKETRDSILRNPELGTLINEMQQVVAAHKGI